MCGADDEFGAVSEFVCEYDGDALVAWSSIPDIIFGFEVCACGWLVKVVEVIDDVVDVPGCDIF